MIPRHSAFQEYRIRVVACWPEGERKRAALESAYSALLRELRAEHAVEKRGPAR